VKLSELQRQWERFGEPDPMRAVITNRTDYGTKLTAGEFFALGRADVDRWVARLVEVGGTAGGVRALDFGCGAGRLTQALARHYEEAVGVDVSRPMLAAAERHNALPGVSFVHNTRDDLTVFSDRSFDLILTHIVLQHLPPPLAMGYLREFFRVLKPGGQLIFQIPTRRIAGRVRYSLIRLLPRLARHYRRARYGATPHMEMHAVPRHLIDETVREGGGLVLAIDSDTSAGVTFESAVYYVRKGDAPMRSAARA